MPIRHVSWCYADHTQRHCDSARGSVRGGSTTPAAGSAPLPLALLPDNRGELLHE